MQERLIELETRYSFQEDSLQELNEVLIRQQQQLDELRRLCARLQERIEDLEASGSGSAPVAGEPEKPPHY